VSVKLNANYPESDGNPQTPKKAKGHDETRIFKKESGKQRQLIEAWYLIGRHLNDSLSTGSLTDC
jgi:hypothetical protein